ncbi:ABC transporter permease [Salimicrobium halophilum]|uniref:ABC-2 type transport system permease protein n=1 Tax=Salimicrobium halophilum TaxID=86666 RepID=A0A1G8V7D8_9BACI|nr:ABC transporter permease [Salimicrobium halophilum]SDJ61981.1 ABC-2 type transport system permease protein [Salimicrobium halophilum]
MAKLLKLIQNENMKLYKRLGTWIMIGIIIIAVLGIGVFSKFFMDSGENTNWQQRLEAENLQLERQLEESPFQSAGEAYVTKQIAINNYRIDQDIPPLHSQSLWGFMIDTTNLTGIIALFAIVIAGGMVASEFSWGTIKLLLIRPVSRTKIILSKYITTILFALFSMVSLFLFSFLIGSVFFGLEGAEDPYLVYNEGEVRERNMISHIIGLIGFNSVDLLMMVTLAFMISTVFRSSSLAIGVSIFLLFTGPQVTQLLSSYDWAKYVLFANTNLQQYTNGTPLVEGMTMTFSIIVLLVYFILFTLTTWVVFKKRDVAA